MRCVSNEVLRVQLLSYLWYIDTTGFIEELQREDGFSPLSHSEYLSLSFRLLEVRLAFMRHMQGVTGRQSMFLVI